MEILERILLRLKLIRERQRTSALKIEDRTCGIREKGSDEGAVVDDDNLAAVPSLDHEPVASKMAMQTPIGGDEDVVQCQPGAIIGLAMLVLKYDLSEQPACIFATASLGKGYARRDRV